MGKSWESSTPDKYSGNNNKYTTDLKKETMKNRKSCFEWASTTNEVINHKWRRNCQELTGRLMLGEQHLSVGNPRNSQSWSFNTGFNKTPREPESGRARLPEKRPKRRFPAGPSRPPGEPRQRDGERSGGPGRARRKRPPPARRRPMGGGRGPRRGEQARRGRRDALGQPPARPGRAGTAPPQPRRAAAPGRAATTRGHSGGSGASGDRTRQGVARGANGKGKLSSAGRAGGAAALPGLPKSN